MTTIPRFILATDYSRTRQFDLGLRKNFPQMAEAFNQLDDAFQLQLTKV